MYDKTASLGGYLTVFIAKYPLLVQSGSIYTLVSKMGYFYECCPGNIAAPVADFNAAAKILVLPSLKA